MRHWLLHALILLISTTAAWAEDPQTLYNSGKLEDALHALQASPTDDSRYFYDLGTVYFKMGDLGHATAYLEKANRMEPHNAHIQHNLRLTQAALAQQIGAEKVDPASTWAESLADRLSIEEVRGALGVSVLILALFWIRAYRRTRRLRATFLHPAAILASAAFLLVGSTYWLETSAAAVPAAIVLESQSVRSGPGPKFQELDRLPAGAKVRQLEGSSSGENGEPWRQVRYSQDAIGWVQAASLLGL